MLGWMLRRGEDAPDPAGDVDNTQIDQPDTPAPVFAARAFKSALFGTPARLSEMPEFKTRLMDEAGAKGEPDSKTPQKPPGILLTPGTGTSRRKRVSFGQEVPKNNPSFATKGTQSRRSRLNDALSKITHDRKKSVAPEPTTQPEKDDFSDDDWEEDDEDDNCHDVTVDLNEPHSQSGRYWKGEFEKYHEDAKAEMEKLLKYKQLAKSYAKQKDAEATQLAEMLKEEQQKVISMENQISESASKMRSRDDRPKDSSPELLATLTKQTALAVQYRTRVQELEEKLEEVLREKDSDSDGKGRRRRLATSPRTQKTLLETQRELRRARNQVKELGELREQVSTLKSQLRSAERRAAKAESQNADAGTAPESSRAQELRSQLREAKEEARKKDDELRLLKKEFEAFKEETKAREEDTKGVLERAHNKISDLKKEVRTLKSAEPESRPKSWHPPAEVDLLAEASTEPDSKPNDYDSKPTMNGARRSFDLTDLDQSLELAPTGASQTLRDKFHKDADVKATQSDLGVRQISNSLGDRPDLGRPRWQPFVPRSPRNRDYLGEEITKKIKNGGATATNKAKEVEAPDLHSLATTIAHSTRRRSSDKNEDKVDLLQDRFKSLGGPDMNTNLYTSNPKSTLAPERRAAALARIEQRMAEKQRAQKHRGNDKENVRP